MNSDALTAEPRPLYDRTPTQPVREHPHTSERTKAKKPLGLGRVDIILLLLLLLLLIIIIMGVFCIALFFMRNEVTALTTNNGKSLRSQQTMGSHCAHNKQWEVTALEQ